MANVERNSRWLESRAGLYLSAILLGLAVTGGLIAIEIWATLGNAELLLATALCSALLGFLGTALMIPRAMRWARSRGWRLPRTSPITLQGLVFVGLILLVAGAALYSGNNLIYLILSAMIAATLMSGLVSRLDLAGLLLSLALPDHIFAKSPALARVGLKNLKLLLPSFAIRVHTSNPDDGFELQGVYFPMVAAREAVTATVEAVFARRGRYRGASVDLVTRFPFGLVERRAKLELKDRIVAYPSVDLTPEAEKALESLKSTALSRIAGDSHDLYRVRPATSSDGARFIHWKASAGSPDLWVREFTQETRFSVRLVLDRRTSNNDAARARFEDLTAACAAVAWRLAADSADVTLVTDERSIVCRAGERIYDLLGYLALVECLPEDGPRPPVGADRDAEYIFCLLQTAPAPEAISLRPS